MIVNNPTDKDITVKLKGVTYTVKANDSLSNVPDKQALYWKELHNFLTLKETANVVETIPEEVVEIPAEDVKEEIAEEEIIPVVEESEEEIIK